MSEHPGGPAGPMGSADVLVGVVRELDRHAAEAGWDQPAVLYALVPTAELVAREPGLAEVLSEGDREGYTPVQQEQLSPTELEALLQRIVWPETVAGAATTLEAAGDDGEEVRVVVAVLRGGAAMCAVRQRAHDSEDAVLLGPALTPGVLALLASTLEDPENSEDPEDPDE